MAFIEDFNIDLEIPAGLLGAEYISVNKFGRTTNLDSGAANATDIWDRASTSADRIWTPLTTADTIDLGYSGNDGLANTGARKVHIYGLDANWDMQDEEISLTGTARSVGSYLRVFRMKVTEWGSLQQNENDIRGFGTASGTDVAQINAGNNQTLMAIYTVPNGYTAFITQYYCSVNRASPSNVSFDIRLLVRPSADVTNNGYQVKNVRGMYINQNHLEHNFSPYLKVEEKSDIVMRGTDCTDNNTDVSAGFDLILIDNTVL